ncbi:MAG: hypothetical protein ACJ8EQ_03770 [Sphingomicrobium sp.]
MSPLLGIGLWALVCVAAFLAGLRFYRMAEPPGEITVDQARRFGRLLMMAATAMLLFLIALWVHGDLKGVRA